jgi:hypothetical protein
MIIGDNSSSIFFHSAGTEKKAPLYKNIMNILFNLI